MSKRFCVYTVITGGFDVVKQPLIVDERFDYILFTDNVESETIGAWTIKPITYIHENKRIASRYPKIYPNKVLSEYEASLYIDGNIQITSQYVYDRCIELVEKGVEWASIKHQGRVGLYSEINAIIGLGWVHDYDVIDWYAYLRYERFPDNMGMFENNIIFRTHSRHVEDVSNIWGNVCVEEPKVTRDQFALMYALWKVPEIKTGYFLAENENAWNNAGHFICENHNPHKRILDKTLWEKLRDRYVRMFYSSGDWEIYYTQWFDTLLKPLRKCSHTYIHTYARIAMHIWTAWVLVRYDLGFLMKRAWKRLQV